MSRQAEELALFNQPMNWPRWPVLPVKHRREKDSTGFPKLGVVLDHSVMPTIKVYEANMLMLPTTQEGWDKLPFTPYHTAEECLADWMID
jgi:hypothetical protein